MRRPILLSLALAVLVAFTASPLVAQDWAKATLEKSPRHREYVAIKHGDRTVQAFVVYPEVSQKAPVVLMIHEIFGLSDWAKEMADEFAAQGFIVIAPDLLYRLRPQRRRHRRLSQPGRRHQGRLRARSGCRHRRPGRRGRLRQELPARQRQDLRRGLLLGRRQVLRLRNPPQRPLRRLRLLRPAARRRLRDITAPVYGFYAGNDARIAATVPATTAAMKAAGKKYEPVIYDGAGHGFMRAGEDPAPPLHHPAMAAANKTARTEGFKRLIALLNQESAASAQTPHQLQAQHSVLQWRPSACPSPECPSSTIPPP